MAKLTIMPQKMTIEVSEADTLLSSLKKSGLSIKSSCGGCASCGDCIIEVLAGDEFLSEQTFEETKLLGNIFHITKERLSCQTKITGDVIINIEKHKQKEVAKVRKTQLRKSKDIEQKVREPREPRDIGFKKPKKFKFSEEE